MSLPIRTTLGDIEAIAFYLATKPTGATNKEARAVLDSKVLDGRKLNAIRFWGIMEDQDDKSRLTELGRRLTKDKGARKANALREIVGSIAPYRAVVERAVHKEEFTITATEVAAHWHQHFKEDASNNDKILNDQAVCFFQVAQGADLGVLTIGRKGQPTRFDFSEEAARTFVEGGAVTLPDTGDDMRLVKEANGGRKESDEVGQLTTPEKTKIKGNRVFITHGKNAKILQQVKEIVSYGKFDPVVAQEHETAAKPVPDKVLDDMRSCQAAVIHVSSEGILRDKDGREHAQLNGNVLIEIGAAMALYGKQFILLVEEGVILPSNLQGLYECRYAGNELGGEATMKLLKAFNEFR